MLEAAFHQVDARPLLIVRQAASEQVVGVKGWQFVIKHLKSKCLAGQKVELTLLKKGFVTTAKAFLEDAHGYKDADGSIGSTHVCLFEQRHEGLLVNPGCYQLEELVMPGLLVGVLLLSSLGKNGAWSCKEV